MAGRPLKKPAQRRNAHPPQLGEWKASPGRGWQHGAIPDAPDGLVAASRDAWTTWFQAWWASNWTPSDLPALRLLIAQFDGVARQTPPKANDVTALTRLMDTYGITPAGQQSRRWTPPKDEDKPLDPRNTAETAPADPYRRLRAVS